MIYIVVLFFLRNMIINSTKEKFDQKDPEDPVFSAGKVYRTFGTVLKNNPNVAKKAAKFTAIRPTKTRDLPSAFPDDDFNSRKWFNYRQKLSKIGNQGLCGGCWAFSTAYSLADRFNLLNKGKFRVQLSPGKLIMCTYKFDDKKYIQRDWTKSFQERAEGRAERVKEIAAELKKTIACSGNDLYSTLETLYTYGVPEEYCIPYGSKDRPDIKVKYDMEDTENSNMIPNCADIITLDFDTCANGKNAMRVFRAADIYALNYSEKEIMLEIYKWGPIAAGFTVYETFISDYDGKSIYTGPKKDSKGNVLEGSLGGHAVRIVGWGTDKDKDGNNTDYWWVANSWSEEWGIRGYFRMKRMIPECELEKNAVAMKPEYPGDGMWDVTGDLVRDINKKLRDQKGRVLDKKTLYWSTAMEKIEKGKLEGSLEPIISQEDLYTKEELKDYWMGDTITDKMSISGIVNVIKTNTMYIDIIFIILMITGVYLINRFVPDDKKKE